MWPLTTSCLHHCGHECSASPHSNPLLFPKAWFSSCHSSVPPINLQRHPVVYRIKFVSTGGVSCQANLCFLGFQPCRHGSCYWHMAARNAHKSRTCWLWTATCFTWLRFVKHYCFHSFLKKTKLQNYYLLLDCGRQTYWTRFHFFPPQIRFFPFL